MFIGLFCLSVPRCTRFSSGFVVKMKKQPNILLTGSVIVRIMSVVVTCCCLVVKRLKTDFNRTRLLQLRCGAAQQ